MMHDREKSHSAIRAGIIDRKDAFFAAEDGNLPPPNFIVANGQPGPRERHAHVGYVLAVPVHKFAMSRRAPIVKVSAIQRRAGGDLRARLT